MNSRHIQNHVPVIAGDTKRELYMSYTAGWRDGAGVKGRDKKFTEHATRPDLKAAYNEGYLDGHHARKAACQAATRIYGYSPTILRATEAEPES
jgi:hypothetical protein